MGLVNDFEALDCCLIIHATNTGYWLTIWVTTTTSKVCASMKVRDLFCASYDITPPLDSQKNTTDAICPYTYLTDLDASTESLSSYVTTNFVTSSCTSHENRSPRPPWMQQIRGGGKSGEGQIEEKR